LLKENIFDRPEVKKFFQQSSRRLYLLVHDAVAMVMPKPTAFEKVAEAVKDPRMRALTATARRGSQAKP